MDILECEAETNGLLRRSRGDRITNLLLGLIDQPID
jgi:hypothetical protein